MKALLYLGFWILSFGLGNVACAEVGHNKRLAIAVPNLYGANVTYSKAQQVVKELTKSFGYTPDIAIKRSLLSLFDECKKQKLDAFFWPEVLIKSKYCANYKLVARAQNDILLYGLNGVDFSMVKTIGVVKNSSSAFHVPHELNYAQFPLEVIEYPDYYQCILALLAGRVDVVGASSALVSNLDDQLKSRISAIYQFESVGVIGLYLNEKLIGTKKGDALVQQFVDEKAASSAAIRKMLDIQPFQATQH